MAANFATFRNRYSPCILPLPVTCILLPVTHTQNMKFMSLSSLLPVTHILREGLFVNFRKRRD